MITLKQAQQDMRIGSFKVPKLRNLQNTMIPSDKETIASIKGKKTLTPKIDYRAASLSGTSCRGLLSFPKPNGGLIRWHPNGGGGGAPTRNRNKSSIKNSTEKKRQKRFESIAVAQGGRQVGRQASGRVTKLHIPGQVRRRYFVFALIPSRSVPRAARHWAIEISKGGHTRRPMFRSCVTRAPRCPAKNTKKGTRSTSKRMFSRPRNDTLSSVYQALMTGFRNRRRNVVRDEKSRRTLGKEFGVSYKSAKRIKKQQGIRLDPRCVL